MRGGAEMCMCICYLASYISPNGWTSFQVGASWEGGLHRGECDSP